MPSEGWRIEILCEDRRAERFLRRLCDRFRIRVLRVDVAPSGKGSAADWVLRRYPEVLKQLRSKNFQTRLGLVVHLDGDHVGLAPRKQQLKADARGDDEPVALMVPCWSIETWLAALCGREVSEMEPLKENSSFSDLWADGRTETATIQKAVEAWPSPKPLPSLSEAQREAVRIGIGAKSPGA